MQRYEDTVKHIRHHGNGSRRYETILYPSLPRRSSDIYIISKQLQRLDLLAARYYDDSRYWWILKKANNLPGGTLHIPPGTRIRIPFPLTDFEIEQLIAEKQF